MMRNTTGKPITYLVRGEEYGEENAFEVKVKLLEVSLGKMMNFAIRIFGDGSFCGSEMF